MSRTQGVIFTDEVGIKKPRKPKICD